MPYMLLMIEAPPASGYRAAKPKAMRCTSACCVLPMTCARGQLLAVESLSAHADAARVQVRDGRVQVLDGPFAEAKEMVSGFFLIDCQTRAEAIAIAIAEKYPAAEWCTVEVRGVGPCYEDAA